MKLIIRLYTPIIKKRAANYKYKHWWLHDVTQFKRQEVWKQDVLTQWTIWLQILIFESIWFQSLDSKVWIAKNIFPKDEDIVLINEKKIC